jgi:hypothetical protein
VSSNVFEPGSEVSSVTSEESSGREVPPAEGVGLSGCPVTAPPAEEDGAADTSPDGVPGWVVGVSVETTAEEPAFFFTVTRHRSVFLPTLALITAFPAFFPFTTPFLLTTATFLLLLAHLIFVFPGAFFTRSFNVFPTRIVAFVRFSFGDFFADAVVVGCTPVPIMATTNTQARTRNKGFFFLIPAPYYPFFLFCDVRGSTPFDPYIMLLCDIVTFSGEIFSYFPHCHITHIST